MAMAMLVLAAAARAQSAEFPLVWKPLSAEEALSAAGFEFVMLSSKPPGSVAKTPEAAHGVPLYAELNIGLDGKPVAVRVDQSANGFYDLLILDVNGNGDLRDDPIVRADKAASALGSNYEQTVFGPIEFQMDGAPAKLRLIARMLIFDRSSNADSNSIEGYINANVAARFEADIALGGVREKIALMDSDLNGRLGDPATGTETPMEMKTYWQVGGGDLLLRDRDGSGAFEFASGSAEIEPCSTIAYFGGKPYAVEIASDLKSMRLTPYQGATGRLASVNAAAIRTLTVAWRESAESKKWIALSPQALEGAFVVPAGQYRLYSCSILGEMGTEPVAAAGTLNETRDPIEVAPNGETAMPMGAPLRLIVEVEGSAGRMSGEPAPGFMGALGSVFSAQADSILNINATVLGDGDERYLEFFKGNQPMKAPRFRIVDMDGKEIDSGQLEYG